MSQDALGNTYDHEPAILPPHVTINDFPVEILINIFSNLSPVEFGTLRLVCQKWNYALSDNAVWANAFSNRFQTGPVFASVTRSQMWLLEYFGRISATKRWAKLKATAQLYRLINNEYGMVDHIETDFIHDRFLMFAKVSGAVSYCTLSLGKHQVFIPDDPLFSRILAYDATWSYLCWGRSTGEIYLKNLATSTASGSNRLSITKLRDPQDSGVPISIVKLNRDSDKFKGKVDIVSVTATGLIEFWSLAGTRVAFLDLEDDVYFLDTDFRQLVVVVSRQNIAVVDFQTQQVTLKFEHGWDFAEVPVATHVDFDDRNVVICEDTEVRIFHFETSSFSVLQGVVPPDVQIIDGTIQKSSQPRNRHIVGGDGLLYAITLSDGSVCVINIRDAPSELKFSTRIMPFSDSRSPSPTGVAQYTKVALNSSVIAIGALTDWIHIYDAHSGEYLREGSKLARKFTRNGVAPILKIEFGPVGACGVVVCGDVVQYFRFGEAVDVKKKPNTPYSTDSSSRRESQRHIKAQIDDYDSQEHIRREQERMADKYNGTNFESEQDELRMAMALSASCTNTEEDLEKALALLQAETLRSAELQDEESDEMDEDLRMALALSEQESSVASFNYSGFASENDGPKEGSSRSQPAPSRNHNQGQIHSHSQHDLENSANESDDEVLRRVLELLLVEH